MTEKIEAKCVDNGVDFKVFYKASNFRVCTVSRLVGVSKDKKEVICAHVSPEESLAIEVEDTTPYSGEQPEKKYYLVVAFAKWGKNDNVDIEEVDDRVKSLDGVNKIRYWHAKKKAVATIKNFHKEKSNGHL